MNSGADPTTVQTETDLANLALAQANAESAKVAAAKAKREEDEASTPTAVAQRAAAAAKDAADARRAQVSALIPDFSKISGTGLSVASGGQPTAGTGVGAEALRRAGMEVARAVLKLVAEDGAVLVATDEDLAASDAAYVNVDAELSRLAAITASALQQIELTREQAPSGSSHEPSSEQVERDLVAPSEGGGAVPDAARSLISPVDVAGGLAQAIPSILSLFTAHRTVTTGSDSADDTAASLAVAGALRRDGGARRIFHDSLRLVPGGALAERVEALRWQRDRLAQRKLELEKRTPSSSPPGPTADVLATALELATSVLAGLDTFLENLMAIPSGATRSPLTTALLRQGLHDGTFPNFLVVKAESSSAMQAVDDKPLWVKDTFAVLGAASIAWALVSASDGSIVDADIVTGTAQANGKIGDTFSVAPN